MAFVQRRCIGDDGVLKRVALGAEVVGNGTLTIAKGAWVKITAVATSGSLFNSLVVGDYYYAPVEITPIAGDKWKVMTLTDMADLAGWSFELSADEVETTVLADTFKQYRKSKKDATGTASFVYIKGVTDLDDNLSNYFFRKINIDATGSSTVSDVKDTPFLLLGYIDQGKESTDDNYTNALVMEVEFYNFSLPMNMAEAVKTDATFRLANGSNPSLYRIALSADL